MRKTTHPPLSESWLRAWWNFYKWCSRYTATHQRLQLNKKYIGDDTKRVARQSLNCIKNKKIWRNTIFNMGDGILTFCNVARSWHWFRQVTARCTVACGSGIVTVNSPSRSTLQCDTWLWDRGTTCHWIRSNIRHIGILHVVPISTTSPQSTCHSAALTPIFFQIGPPPSA